MSDAPAISVIMPVYNMAQYLPQALQSVLTQSLKTIEIICIDDCSTDQSPAILQTYQDKDNRIKIQRMPENAGSGPCRNKGMAMAKGDYIAFLDPDDLIAEGALEKLYRAAQDTGDDIVGGNLLAFYDNDPASAIDFGKATFKENRRYSYADDYPFSVGYYRFIYKRDFIDRIAARFPPLRRYQDPVWFVQVMMQAKTFYGLNSPVYLYRKSHQKITVPHAVMDQILTGVLQNIAIFREAGLPLHAAREKKELGYYIYGFLYGSLPKGIDYTTETIGLIRYHAARADDLSFSWGHVYGFLRYGLTLIKLHYLYRKNKKAQKVRYVRS